MFKEIVIVGGGKLGCLIAKNLIKINDNIIINIITRNKDKLAQDFLSVDRIIIKNYEDEIEKGLPCVITVSCNETSIIKKLIESGEQNISRFSVAPFNMEIMDGIFPYLFKLESIAYFILTNPVEHIIGHLLKNGFNTKNIYGLGLDLDSRRFEKSIRMLSGVFIENLTSIGTHISPIPVLDGKLNLDDLKLNIDEIIRNLEKNNNYEYNNSNLDIYLEFLKFIEQSQKKWSEILSTEEFLFLINGLTSILIRSEFLDGKPPIHHPVDSVSKVLNSFLSNQYINVSYVRNLEIIGGLIKINNKGGYIEYNS